MKGWGGRKGGEKLHLVQSKQLDPTVLKTVNWCALGAIVLIFMVLILHPCRGTFWVVNQVCKKAIMNIHSRHRQWCWITGSKSVASFETRPAWVARLASPLSPMLAPLIPLAQHKECFTTAPMIGYGLPSVS